MLDVVLSLNVFHFIMVAARVGGAVMLLPGFSATYVSVRVRVLLSLVISLVLVPVLSDRLPDLPTAPAEMGRLLAIELLAGVFIGTVARVLIAALQVAGTVISLTSSMANAFIMDPVAEQQGSIVTSFLTMVGVTLIFVTDLHHMMLLAVVDSYRLFEPGLMPSIGDMAQMMAENVARTFQVGVQLAGPYLVAGISYNLAMGLITRLMPQMPVYFVGLPAQMLGALFLMMVVLPGIMLVFLQHFQTTLQSFLAP